MIYLLARKWRGVINIASMRYFPDPESLAEHLRLKTPEHWSSGVPYHVYQVYLDGREAKALSLKESRSLGLRPPASSPRSSA